MPVTQRFDLTSPVEMGTTESQQPSNQLGGLSGAGGGALGAVGGAPGAGDGAMGVGGGALGRGGTCKHASRVLDDGTRSHLNTVVPVHLIVFAPSSVPVDCRLSLHVTTTMSCAVYS